MEAQTNTKRADCGYKTKASPQFPGKQWCPACGLDNQAPAGKPDWLYEQPLFNDRRGQ